MGLVADAGPLIALERGDRAVRKVLAEVQGDPGWGVTPATTLAEVWRGGTRMANFSVGLRTIKVVPVDERIGRLAGELLAAAKSAATLDAIVVVIAAMRLDAVLTSDPDDLEPLCRSARVRCIEV